MNHPRPLPRLLLILALILSMLGCQSATPPATAQSANAPQAAATSAIANALASAVILYTDDGDLVCAGQRIAPGVIATAQHCLVAATASDSSLDLIDDAEASGDDNLVNVLMALFAPSEGTILHYTTYAQTVKAGRSGKLTALVSRVGPSDVPHDIALLLTSPSDQPFVEMRDLKESPLAVGIPVFSIGHPAGLEFTYSRGYISTICRWLRGPECWIQADMAIYGGNSGGGLFDDQGTLIGVASRRVGFNYAFFSPAGSLLSLMR